MLPKACARCGKPGAALCPECRQTNPRYREKEYLRNRQFMISEAWRLGAPCWKCGRPFLRRDQITADHKTPLREGGTHELSNLAPAHEGCNKGWSRKTKHETPAPVVDSFRKVNEYLEW